MRASWYDTFLRSFGFNPSRIATMREKQWKDKQIEFHYGDKRSAIYSKVRRFWLQSPRSRSTEEWFKITQEIGAYNAMIHRRGLVSVSQITPSTLKRVRTNMDRAPRRERLRDGEATAGRYSSGRARRTVRTRRR
jgi:hypothetical protein